MWIFSFSGGGDGRALSSKLLGCRACVFLERSIERRLGVEPGVKSNAEDVQSLCLLNQQTLAFFDPVRVEELPEILPERLIDDLRYVDGVDRELQGYLGQRDGGIEIELLLVHQRRQLVLIVLLVRLLQDRMLVFWTLVEYFRFLQPEIHQPIEE